VEIIANGDRTTLKQENDQSFESKEGRLHADGNEEAIGVNRIDASCNEDDGATLSERVNVGQCELTSPMSERGSI